MKSAICNETYRGVGFEDVCVDVASCGFDAIEVALNAIAQDPGTLTVEDGRRLGSVARANGLEVVGLHWLLAAPGGLHLTTNDDATRSRTVRYLQHLAELCAAMGGRILVLGSPNQRGVLPGQSYDEAFAHATEACRTVDVEQSCRHSNNAERSASPAGLWFRQRALLPYNPART